MIAKRFLGLSVLLLVVFSQNNAASAGAHAFSSDQTISPKVNLVPSSDNSTSNLCLTPTPADNSTEPVQPTGPNTAIPGNVMPLVNQGRAQYKAPMPQNFTLHMQLVFKLRNADQFKKCLASINDPTSSNYGKYLNSTTLEPYVPTPGQRASMAWFLRGSGFNVTNGASPLVLKLMADVENASIALAVNISLYLNANRTFYAADSDPRLPQTLAVLVNSIEGLQNMTSISHSATAPDCSLSSCPQGIQVGYGLSSLYSEGFNGAGQKVAIVDMPGDPYIQSATDTFSDQFGLPRVTLEIHYPDGPPSEYDTAWAAETAMDVEAVHSVAPGGGIVLLYDDVLDIGLMNAIDYVAMNHLASIVSNSWTYGCPPYDCTDAELGPSLVSSVDSRLATDAALGLTILFASGDQGSRPGGSLGTEFPASDPNVLAVGGTNLEMTGCTAGVCTGYGTETAWGLSGGGYSQFFPEPSWQTAYIGIKPGRAVPDVSMIAGTPAFWVYSTTANSCSGGSGGGWFPCFGTSLSTPLWAGFLAIAAQMKGGPLGQVNPLIYGLGAGASHSSLFHDVVSGSNGDYFASVGWDPVTGWGTPLAGTLVAAISQTTALAIPLRQGWNLVSLPLVLDNTAIKNVLAAQIASKKVSIVWGYSANTRTWQYFTPNAPSTLTTMTDGNGYWIYMRKPDTLYVSGTIIAPGSAPPTYSLIAGWNLVGYKPQPDVTTKTVHDYLSSIDTKYDESNVWVYNNVDGTWSRGVLTTLHPGDAMWIYMNSAATLNP